MSEMQVVIHAEKAVLGCILLDNGTVLTVRGVLQVEDFEVPAHRAIYAGMLALADQRTSIDPVTLSRYYGQLTDIVSLTEAVPTSANVEHYAELVRNNALRRRVRAVGAGLSKDAGSADDPRVLIASRISTMTAMLDGPLLRPELVADTVAEVYTQAERAAAGEAALALLPTGLTAIDRRIGGLGPGELWIVGARPSIGKTGFGLSLALRCAGCGLRALYVSLEMTRHQLVRRLLSHASGLKSDALRRGELADNDWPALARAAGEISSAPMATLDRSRIRLREIVAAVELAAVRGWPGHDQRLGLVIIDYLQLVRASERHRSREEEVAEVSRELKALAKAIHLPIVALAQINREVDKRPTQAMDVGPGEAKVQLHAPRLSDLRESGSIEADADVVLLLHREHVFDSTVDPEDGWIFIAKSRESGAGRVRARFHKTSTLWEDAA